jgi:hypothetical protein
MHSSPTCRLGCTWLQSACGLHMLGNDDCCAGFSSQQCSSHQLLLAGIC